MATLPSRYPAAVWTPYPQWPTGNYTDTNHYKVVWHKTQGGDGVLNWYPRSGGIPKFTILSTGVVHQHYSMNKYDRALRNQSGGVQTNLDGAISIEMVGFVGQGSTTEQLVAMRKLSAWFVEIGIKTGWLNGPPTTGARTRLSQNAWDNGRGHCGHVDVPENDHTDPRFVSKEIAAIESAWNGTGSMLTTTPREEWYKLYNQANPLVENSVVSEVQDFLKHAALGPDGKLKRYYGFTTDGKRGAVTDAALRNWKIDRWGNPDAGTKIGSKAWNEINRQLFMVHVQEDVAPVNPVDCSAVIAKLATSEAKVAELEAKIAGAQRELA